MDILYLILGGFLSGAIGALGVGGGGVLIVFLSLFTAVSREQASVINLWFFIPIAIMSVIIYIKQNRIDIKKAVLLALPGLLGSAFGVYLSGVIETDIVTKIFGGLLVFASVKMFFTKENSRN